MEAVGQIEMGGGKALESGGYCIQPAGFLLELSLDWIVLRASENIHQLLGKSHVTLIDEPLGRFVHSQALHDLRNLFSRLSGTTGVGRAYAVRLTDDNERVDIAFQLSDGRVVLEAVPSAGTFGECFGTVGGLVAGLSGSLGQGLLEGGARRMRALTGYDRVTLIYGDRAAESTRGPFASPAAPAGLPQLIADTQSSVIELFPHSPGETALEQALMRAPAEPDRVRLQDQGIRAMMRVAFEACDTAGEFCCESRTPRAPNFELHAAAELFAQMFALRLELDRSLGDRDDQPAK